MTPSELKNNMLKEVEQTILPFWMFKACDLQNGGYWGSVKTNGLIDKQAAKGSILHCRILWSFSAAYAAVPNPAWLEHAQRCFSFIQQHLLQENGYIGWDSSNLTEFNTAADQTIAQAYWLYASSELALTTRQQQHSTVAKQNWTNLMSLIEGKGFATEDNPTSFGWRTWLHIIESLDKYASIANSVQITEQINELLSRTFRLFDINSDMPISNAHLCASAWMLIKWCQNWAPRYSNRASNLACKLVDKAIERAYMPNGGFIASDEDPAQYGWVQAEAMLACWRCYLASNDPKYLKHTLELWQFIQQFISDPVYGEWHWQKGATDKAQEKAGFWKCPYHNSRACLEIFNDLSEMDITHWKQ
ncbi:AGE family epimerase/isomerase [Neptunicella marina]|uniref:AGE family epimerase/isomerase n=1 Tax=Neptunicella marina TaxID=2125989 RepID=A0A8J6LWV7_9ALTE|nr:AGE family epimerase/isomerase [Neptunicella marina]MBC3765369.1 AGE family epimerase/isomerase [Neptunicella marina]